MERLSPLGPFTDLYLFQLPPSFNFSSRNEERLKILVESTGLGRRTAVEFRHESWFLERGLDLCRDLGVTFVSVDSPMGMWIGFSNGVVYLRVDGRGTWYSYDYSVEELTESAELIDSLSPSKVYVFFNGDRWMLENARVMHQILQRSLK